MFYELSCATFAEHFTDTQCNQLSMPAYLAPFSHLDFPHALV